MKFARDLRRNPIPPTRRPGRGRHRFRTVPSVSAGRRRLHFSGLEREHCSRSVRNEGHQFNVADAFSWKEVERERERDGDEETTGGSLLHYYIREVYEKDHEEDKAHHGGRGILAFHDDDDDDDGSSIITAITIKMRPLLSLPSFPFFFPSLFPSKSLFKPLFSPVDDGHRHGR